MQIEIVVVKGHLPGLYELERPIWQGELDEFCAANEGLSEQDIAIELTAYGDGFSRIGGGAAPEFTIYTREAREQLVEAIYEAA